MSPDEIALDVLGECNGECTDKVISADCRLHDCGTVLKRYIKLERKRLAAAVEAMKSVLPYLERSTDQHIRSLVYHSPASQLRMQADRIEDQDRIVAEFRAALKEIQGE